MTLEETVQEIHSLDTHLGAYEQKYGIISADFYRLYCQGFLGDEGFELAVEYRRWATVYKLKLKREEIQQSLLNIRAFHFSEALLG